MSALGRFLPVDGGAIQSPEWGEYPNSYGQTAKEN
jgi:hypothetical protein